MVTAPAPPPPAPPGQQGHAAPAQGIPLSVLLILVSVSLPSQPCYGDTSPPPCTHPPALSLSSSTLAGAAASAGVGAVRGEPTPRCHTASGAGSLLPAFFQPSPSLPPAFPRQLRREGALQPLKRLCEPARPCPFPARHRRCKAWVSQPLLPAPELLQSCSRPAPATSSSTEREEPGGCSASTTDPGRAPSALLPGIMALPGPCPCHEANWDCCVPPHTCTGQVRSLLLQPAHGALGVWPFHPTLPAPANAVGKSPVQMHCWKQEGKPSHGVWLGWGSAFPGQGQHPQNQIKGLN